ncbi:Cullin binding-domain-containing protein [Mariannaea sp. PMI_226]|nr:Cullin binding-domain-containing protein [Mariannaea sp. PMI_226]
MPPPSSAHQKVMVAQFVALTGAPERHALRFLKSSGFKLNEAVDSTPMGWRGVKNRLSSRVIPSLSLSRKPSKQILDASIKESTNEPKSRYFSSNIDNGPSPLEIKLESLFTELQDASDEKGKLELESTMSYLTQTLKVSIENAELFVALEVVQAPTVGVITKKGYVDGWKVTGVGASHQEHAAHIKNLISSLSTNHALFKKVYRYTFVVGRENDQKALTLENALIYWSILFSAPGIAWQTKNHNWLELWKKFLGEKWTRSVNRDMWNMTLEFALKSMSDEDLSFWNEDGAWPSVIDDFVEWCKGKGIGKAEVMEIDL